MEKLAELNASCVRLQMPRYDSLTLTRCNGGNATDGHAGAISKPVARGSFSKCWRNVNAGEEEDGGCGEDQGTKKKSVAASVKLTTAATGLESLAEADWDGRLFDRLDANEGEEGVARERRKNDGYASEESFDGQRDYLTTTTDRVICGTTGTVRGMRNRVRAGIATFIHHSFLNEANQKDYARSERGRVVVYTTTNGIVRRTFQRCLRVNTILATLLIQFEERNTFLRKDYLREFNQRMCNVINSHEESHRHVHRHNQQQQSTDDGHRSKRWSSLNSNINKNNDDFDLLPQVFVDGRYLGGATRIETLNEVGILKRILQPYRRLDANRVCEMCGNYRLLLCGACNGSKKSIRCNSFRFTETGRQVPLRCTNCDENGLVTCHACKNAK